MPEFLAALAANSPPTTNADDTIEGNIAIQLELDQAVASLVADAEATMKHGAAQLDPTSSIATGCCC